MQYWVQGHRNHAQPWVTDTRHATLPAAIVAAEQLHYVFDRAVRVIDSEEGRVHFKLGTLQHMKKHHAKRKAAHG